MEGLKIAGFSPGVKPHLMSDAAEKLCRSPCQQKPFCPASVIHQMPTVIALIGCTGCSHCYSISLSAPSQQQTWINYLAILKLLCTDVYFQYPLQNEASITF